jgi:diguanylate cyclase (GGDEF)-like protein
MSQPSYQLRSTAHVGIPGGGQMVRMVRPLLMVAILGFSIWHYSPLRRFDAIWSDILLSIQARPFTQEILVVSITPEDVITNGSERLSRRYLADTLRRLADGGVTRVLLDFNLGGGLTIEEEIALQSAMQTLGRERLALAYEPDPINRTRDSLLQFAQTVNLSLHTDFDGRIRSMIAFPGIAPNACRWLARGEQSERSTPLDRRQDPTKIQRLSLAELHARQASPGDLQGKLVIISHDRRVTRSRVFLPILGETDRGTVLALGTASCLGNYGTEIQTVSRLQLALFLVSLASGFLIGLQAPKVTQAALGIGGLVALNLFMAWQLTSVLGGPSRPFSGMLAVVAAMKIALAFRLRVTELFSGIMSGVLSPEEVWLWRVYGDRSAPVLLFDAMGHLKKANQAALQELHLQGQVGTKTTTPLARQMMPSLGQRTSQLTTQLETRRIWEVEWPSENLPLAILTDVTEQHDELQQLQQRLQTDTLTGTLNRTGFEARLEKCVERGDGDYAIYFLDMNGFKAVNDRYGHAAGDELLKIAAVRFRSILRERDAVARFGGDEFAILIGQSLTGEQAAELRGRIEATLNGPIQLGEVCVEVGVAAGFALPWSGDEPGSAVMERADLEMYRRKSELKAHLNHAGQAAASQTPVKNKAPSRQE